MAAPRLFGAPMALLLGYLLYAFVGTHPLADASAQDRIEGSPLDRIAVLGMFALSLAVFWAHRRQAWTCLRGTIGLVVVVGFCLLSVRWSNFPDLTLRRSLLFFFLTFTAVAIAASVNDLRRLHTILFVTLTGVIMLNLVAVAAMPSVAISDIGVRGLYSQKNVAGSVAMIALVCGAAWALGAERAGARMLGVVALAPTALFLVLTRSKTSIGLAVLALAIAGMLALADRLGQRFALFMLALAPLALAILASLFAAIDFDVARALDIVLGDATFTGRDELWAFAWRSALRHPWLGHGYGAFWDVGVGNDPLLRLEPGTWLGDVEAGTINQAHNGYLELCLHIGIPATIFAALTIMVGAASATRRALTRGAPRRDRAAVAALAMILWLYIAHNQIEATLFMRGSAFYSIAVLALLVVARARDLTTARNVGPQPPLPNARPST